MNAVAQGFKEVLLDFPSVIKQKETKSPGKLTGVEKN